MNEQLKQGNERERIKTIELIGRYENMDLPIINIRRSSTKQRLVRVKLPDDILIYLDDGSIIITREYRPIKIESVPLNYGEIFYPVLAIPDLLPNDSYRMNLSLEFSKNGAFKEIKLSFYKKREEYGEKPLEPVVITCEEFEKWETSGLVSVREKLEKIYRPSIYGATYITEVLSRIREEIFVLKQIVESRK